MIAKKYMCPECFKLFTESKANEMKFKHHCHAAYDGDYLIPIDEPIAEAISTMNQKGYTTKYCCSGHWEGGDVEKIARFYVTFEVPLHAVPYLLSHAPIGLGLTCDINSMDYLRHGVIPMHLSGDGGLSMYVVDMDEDTELTEEFYNASQKWADESYVFSFKKWVEMLPDIEDLEVKE